jgi:hypothetical protein
MKITVKPTPIIYSLVVQCVRPEIGVIAEYKASTPFPHFSAGDMFELFDCEPRGWDVNCASRRIISDKDGQVYCTTILLVDSPVVENTGYVVKKQNGDEVGPSPTRFGRIEN